MRRTPPIAVAALLLLAGCAGTPAASEPDPDAPLAAIGLVNLWRVTGAEDAGDEVYLRLGAGGLDVWSDCGMGSGGWRGGDTTFVGDVSMGTGNGNCLPDLETGEQPESLAWLYAARAFRPVDDGFELLDDRDEVVATLAVDGAPPASPNYSAEFTRPPAITAEVTAAFARPTASPDRVSVVDAATLLGRWEVARELPFETAFVDFASDGSWKGSDGCNHRSGRWALGEDGRFFATVGMSGEVGCNNVLIPEWVSGASSVTLADDQLAFIDASGATLGSVSR